MILLYSFNTDTIINCFSRVVRTILIKIGFKELQSDTTSIFEVLLELYGSLLIPFFGRTSSFQSNSSAAFPHHLYSLLQSILDGGGEWADDVRGVVQKFLSEVPDTLSMYFDYLRKEQNGVELDPEAVAYLSGKSMNRAIGLFALFGEWYDGIFPGDYVLFQGKGMSLLEEHVIVSYSKRNAFGEAFQVTPANRAEKEIHLEYAQVSSISPDVVERVRGKSEAVQQVLVDNADKLLTVVNMILAAQWENISAPATMLLSIFKIFAMDTVSNLGECLKVKELKDNLSLSSTVTKFSSTLQQYLLLDIVTFSISNGIALDSVPVSCYDSLTRLLQAFCYGHYGFDATSNVDRDKWLRTREVAQRMIVDLGEAVTHLKGTSTDDAMSTDTGATTTTTTAIFSDEIMKAFSITKAAKKYSIDDGEAVATASLPSSTRKVVKAKTTRGNLHFSQSTSQAMSKALSNNIVFKSYKLLCEINKYISSQDPASLAPTDYGQLYLLLKIAGLGQIGTASPLLKAVCSNFGRSTALTPFVNVCKVMFSNGLAYIDDEGAWNKFMSRNRNTLNKNDAVFEQNSARTAEISEGGKLVKLNSDKAYVMVSVTMDSGIWEWEMKCIKEKNGDESSFIGVCRRSITNGKLTGAVIFISMSCNSSVM